MSILELKNNYNINNIKPFIIVLFFRISGYFTKNLFLKIVGIPIRILYKIGVEWILGVELPDTTQIGDNLKIHHGVGLVVNPHVIIGSNVTLKHTTTIGCKFDINDNCIAFPRIGNNVIIHPHCIIYGDIEIGDNCIIGAGSLVNKSFPPNMIIAGNPATIIKRLN